MQETLESIYREHRQGLFTLALSITRSAERAEDAVHDAFARLCRAPGKPAGDPVAYAFAAVRNAAIDITRKRSELPMDFEERSGDSIFDDGTHNRTSAVEIGETQDAVKIALDDLPYLQRQVLVLKIYAGLTFDQIAQTCGEPLSTIASRYRRALDQLKDRLKSVV